MSRDTFSVEITFIGGHQSRSDGLDKETVDKMENIRFSEDPIYFTEDKKGRSLLVNPSHILTIQIDRELDCDSKDKK